MHWILNALPITNQSGAHVVLTHLRRLAQWTAGAHRCTVLLHAGNAALRCDLGPGVEWRVEPACLRHWVARAAWERLALPGLVRRLGADLLLMTSGTALARCPVPQAVLAMNPWCLVPGVPSGAASRAKAALQRAAYRDAVRRADMMIYLSGYLRDAYRGNAGCAERRGVVAYTAPGDDLLREGPPAGIEARDRFEVLCVSAMAPHKGIETLVEAVRDVRDRHGIPARLRLVGEWPDRRYEVRIRLAAGALAGAVEFAGHLPRADLVAAYRRAAVFCLLSRCESFGIPGLEAQACGTPVVCSAVGGLPEVYGEGAVCVPVDEPEAAAAALADLLSDRGRWQRLAAAALRNAARFDPEEVSRPLMRMFEPGADPGEGER